MMTLFRIHLMTNRLDIDYCTQSPGEKRTGTGFQGRLKIDLPLSKEASSGNP
jgi:hypothetical protein